MQISNKTILHSLKSPLTWIFFALYIGILIITITHHEMWGDEIHSWNIAKASNDFGDVLTNSRYEGHPPIWYSILWIISKFTHDIYYVQVVQVIIATLIVFLIIFLSPLPLSSRLLTPFGYFFLYEYGVLSRNYTVGILFALCICIIMRKNFKGQLILYYSFLILLSNTHLLGLLLAASLHIYFLIFKFEKRKKLERIVVHILVGLIASLPALYFIFPPFDSQLSTQYWIDRWDPHQIIILGQAPLRSFIPIPAWWEHNIWNTQVLLEGKIHHPFLKFINPVLALAPLVIGFLVLRKNRKGLVLFFVNLFLSIIVAVAVFPLTSARYAGFIFIGFIVSFWMSCYETPVSRRNSLLVTILLAIQVLSSFFLIQRDIKQPFSNAYRVKELLANVPPNERAVTDYWAMNTISAFMDSPFYCIDLQKEKSYVQWTNDLTEMMARKYRYCDGIEHLFKKEGINKVYMVSTGSPETIFNVDPKLSIAYDVTLVEKIEGAIEKGGNLYLYEIRSR